MSGIWPADVQCAAMLTFDVDGVSSWIRRDAGFARLPSLMSMAEYGPAVATPRILDLLDRHAIPASSTFQATSPKLTRPWWRTSPPAATR